MSKRKLSHGNHNHMEDAIIYPPERIREAIGTVKCGQEEVIIIDSAIETECPGIEMVHYWNTRSKKQYHVEIPESFEDITLNGYKTLPGITGGMWHAYATSAHDQALDSPVVDAIFTEIVGTPHWKVHPNRMRFNGVNSDDGYKSAHLEGLNVLKQESGISAILCMTAGRTFTYYKGSNNDPETRKLFCELGGPTSLFVQPSQSQLEKWPRTTIRTTKPGQIILFADSVTHEISRIGKNTMSLFLSPYDPSRVISEIDFYEGLNRNEAIAKQKQSMSAPPLPSHFRTPGWVRCQPKQFAGMSQRDTEIFGSLFHSTGYCWPSGKSTCLFMHMRAFNAFKPKLLPFCFDSNGKFNYEIITPELVANCPEFDQTYFENLPLANVSEVDILAMRVKYTGIPDAAWPLVKYWTKDPRKCSENVCKRRDYIK